MRRLIAALTAAALAFPSVCVAQSQPFDPSKLGVSLDRIRRELDVGSGETINSNGLKLEIRIDVFGQAPPINILPEDFSLTTGPVPRSAPTHREHIEHVTPKEFRAPAVPILGLAVWAAQKLSERSKKARCEEEVEAYRQAVMAGIAIAAPRCTQ